VIEESYQTKLIRAGYVEQKMREGKSYDEAMKLFDELKLRRPKPREVRNVDFRGD
jgi:hypothetical protein